MRLQTRGLDPRGVGRRADGPRRLGARLGAADRPDGRLIKQGARIRRQRIPIRDVSLYVDIVGHGYPLVLMHGGPSADLWSMQSFRRLADQFTLIFYDHRCNGRSQGAPVSSMTWENLTADADALRERLGFDRWAVLGHSFGGHVALEYALRYPDRLSHLVLLDTGADGRWARQNAPALLASRGYDPAKVELVRRWFHGEITPKEYWRIFLRIADAYCYGASWPLLAHFMVRGGWRSKIRPEPFIFASRHLLDGWTVVDRLGEIAVPTLVMAGRADFVFPPECQQELAAGIQAARLRLIDRAGHSPQDEQTAEVMNAIRDFVS
jgi:proline iminopeptidase